MLATRYKRRLWIRLLATHYWLLATAIVISLAGCGRQAASPSAPSRLEIWAALQPQAARYQIDPGFIYALVAAESNFDPGARNGDARGLLQIKPAAWNAVSDKPYEPGVWDWRLNLETGIDYLAYSRAYLHKKNSFSYPFLLAAFHYGIEYVEERGFDISRIPVPPNAIYRKLWAGNLEPPPTP